jgi:hypothetical protein
MTIKMMMRSKINKARVKKKKEHVCPREVKNDMEGEAK